MSKQLEKQIFRNGSTTYYWSSVFFPKQERSDIFRLYSFVRVADDYVDAIPQQKEQFNDLVRLWQTVSADTTYTLTPNDGDSIDLRVVKNIVYLQRNKGIKKEWVEAFIKAMQSDTKLHTYKTIDDSLAYVYGSAEVIGLMMCQVLGIPKQAHKAAMMQGRAMQWINFIRDIDEDNRLGRQYFPQFSLNEHGLENLTSPDQEERINTFIRSEITRYSEWQERAYEGYRYIPRRYQIPIATAADMYNWTAHQINKNPSIVFTKKLKPSRFRVLITVLKHSLRAI